MKIYYYKICVSFINNEIYYYLEGILSAKNDDMVVEILKPQSFGYFVNAIEIINFYEIQQTILKGE